MKNIDLQWQEEYTEAGACFRKYTDFLIEILKGFAAGNTLLFAALAYLASSDQGQRTFSLILLAGAGVALCGGTLVVQRRSYQYWLTYLQRAVELEKDTPASLYTHAYQRAVSGTFTSHSAACVLYSTVLVVWILVTLKSLGVHILTIPL